MFVLGATHCAANVVDYMSRNQILVDLSDLNLLLYIANTVFALKRGSVIAGMIGYGMAKAAVHQLVHSLACDKSGLPGSAFVSAILP